MGQFDFDHHCPFCVFDRLPQKIELFAWWAVASFSARRGDHFQNKNMRQFGVAHEI